MAYHIDPLTLKLIACEEGCQRKPHYSSEHEAKDALALMLEMSELRLQQNEIHFQQLISARTGREFLEASLRTPFDEDVFFTVESQGAHVVGSMMLAGNEYVLARAIDSGDRELLAELAKKTVNEAKRLHRLDIWPAPCVIQLYKELKVNSTSTQLLSNRLRLIQSPEPGCPQLYSGETGRGVEISVRAAFGYAVAAVDYEEGREIVHEAGLSHQLFVDDHERNVFVAKAFGELIQSGSI